MVTPIVLPKLGNTVESSIILQWHKAPGDDITEGDILCEVETDKATMEVESPVAGTLLALFYEEGDDVPVLANIAAVGEAGEAFEDLRPADSNASAPPAETKAHAEHQSLTPTHETPVAASTNGDDFIRISPRAKKRAQQEKIDLTTISGTGPLGRIIERDIEAAQQAQPAISPVARAMLETGEFIAPERGSGARGRITKADLMPAQPETTPDNTDDFEVIPLKGVRKTIARRMLESLQTTAQLTLSRSAPAQGLLDMRKWLKTSPAALGLRGITLNDLVLYAVAKTLPDFPDLNTLFEQDTLYRYHQVHLGFAVDTPRGLVVPVIHNADEYNLLQLAEQAHQLAQATHDQRLQPDQMGGGTFTVSNLGSLGIETFTPVLNPPQVAILGVGSIAPKAIATDEGYDFAPHIALSLTINHQVVDGAPGARFLQALVNNLETIQDLA